ncbi:MAG: ATP-dependent Clp protease proteolytic subunit [Pirellulaceae bacterium]|jgi:ATP-dependent protease ClpP protease subunit|nr:ATP-dependent Clp protease proteolytic subunit [Pirellulaceae bacterium]MDP7017134.1 ATP-dependent Clp protease proteolytic subunit [Pirellulaceae bacterium]
MGRRDDQDEDRDDGIPEIAINGDLTDSDAGLEDRLLDVPPGEECILYFDSPGGPPYTALSLMSLIKLRGLRATGVVTGECSSAALWPFAACQRRLVTAYSALLFHPMEWESGEHIKVAEAAEWARHFRSLEHTMDELLAETFGMSIDLLREWSNPGRYVTGMEMAEAGLAELVELQPLGILHPPQSSKKRR